jgi:RNA polymerase sigma-70 factor (ECF subfamily)
MATTADSHTSDLVSARARRAGRIDDGQAAAFDALYRAEYRPLMRIAFGLTGSTAEAEEIVQEAFLRCHQRWRKVMGYDRPGAWLRRVVLNLSTSRLRRVRHEARVLRRVGSRPRDHDPGPGGDAGVFWHQVQELPLRQRQAVVLYYGEDLPVAGVADLMGCAEGTVRALLHQARSALAARSEEER